MKSTIFPIIFVLLLIWACSAFAHEPITFEHTHDTHPSSGGHDADDEYLTGDHPTPVERKVSHAHRVDDPDLKSGDHSSVTVLLKTESHRHPYNDGEGSIQHRHILERDGVAEVPTHVTGHGLAYTNNMAQIHTDAEKYEIYVSHSHGGKYKLYPKHSHTIKKHIHPDDEPVEHPVCYGNGEPHSHRLDAFGFGHGIDHGELEIIDFFTVMHVHPVCKTTPPKIKPPVKKPPTEEPPGKKPPDEEPPGMKPPTEEPPPPPVKPPGGDPPDDPPKKPPVEEPPTEEPPGGDEPPTEEPPTEEPPEELINDGSSRSLQVDDPYELCVLKSKVVEGIQVVEFMVNYEYKRYNTDGELWFEKVYPQWFEVLNTTDEAINLKGAVLKHADGDAEIETDFVIDANSVGIIATLPPLYFRVRYNFDGVKVVRREFQANINGATYYAFSDTYDHDIDLRDEWSFEFNGKEVFKSSEKEGSVTFLGEPCQYPSRTYDKGLLFYSRLGEPPASLFPDPTPGYYEAPAPAAPSLRRLATTTWADIKKE